MRVFSTLYKWIGIAAALISFATAVWGLLNAAGELRERKRVVTEQVAAGRAEEAAGDFTGAWDSFARARTSADYDGLFAKLLGGLSAQRQTVKVAQEDLAMHWIREAHATTGHPFAEVADKVTDVLSTGAATNAGARKADLLAHLGWSYFLKSREGAANVAPDVPYKEAVAADATNPYANAFWGHWILWEHGPFQDALQRFNTALETGRARAEVRMLELTGLANVHTDEADAEWIRVVNQMRMKGEAIDASTVHELYTKYYFALNDNVLLQKMLAAVPAEDHLDMQHSLLQSAGLETYQKQGLTAVMAETLEADGKKDEALAAWRELQTQLNGDKASTLTDRVDAAIKRLEPPAKRPKAKRS